MKNTIKNIMKDFKKTVKLKFQELRESLFGDLYSDVFEFARKETEQVTCRPELANFQEIPADLQDKEGLMNLTARGYAVSGRITMNDVLFGSKSPASFFCTGVFMPILFCLTFLPYFFTMCFRSHSTFFSSFCIIYIAFFFLITLFSASFICDSFIELFVYILLCGLNFFYATEYPLLLFISLFIICLFPVLSCFFQNATRLTELVKSSEEGTVLTLGNGIKKAKKIQIEQAQKDKTKFLKLGSATGYLRFFGDEYAPDANISMGLTIQDLSKHLFILGATGSGKTSSIFKPLIRQFCDNKTAGCVIMDGKGQLPAEIAQSIEDFTLITPETARLSIVQGLEPEDISAIIYDTQASKQATDQIWNQQAEKLLRNASILLKEASVRNEKIKWNLSNVDKIINDKNFLSECSEVIAMSNLDVENHLVKAGSYYKNEYMNLEKKYKNSVISQVNSWLSAFFSNRKLQTWCEESEGVDITTALTGEKFGLCLPAFEYGLAGTAITALVKMRLYRALQKRGDTWRDQKNQTICLLAIDEAQEVLNQSDFDIAPVARSLGLCLCCGTQTIEQLIEKYHEKYSAFAFLSQFRSIISFESSTETLEYISKRVGEARLAPPKSIQIAYDYLGGLKQIAASTLYDPEHPNAKIFKSNRENFLSTIKSTIISAITKENEEEEKKGITKLKRELEEREVVRMQDLNTQLSVPYVAFASFNRANVNRRDFMICDQYQK